MENVSMKPDTHALPRLLSAAQVAEFYQQGFIIVRGLIDSETVRFGQ